MKTVIVIPARLASTRLPGKPLADIHGRPMIAWMTSIALAADVGPVLVAAGEPEIAAAARAAGADAVLTDPDLPSGTDRVAAAISGLDADIVVNLQGDMPTLDPTCIAKAMDALHTLADADIATLVSPSRDPLEKANPNLVKAVISFPTGAPIGRALYFTRAPAPFGEGAFWRHVGLYVYRRAALERFVAAPPSPLEARESLEQLRALEMGMTIAAAVVEDFPKGVDSPPDLELARQVLAERGRNMGPQGGGAATP